ncbi:hypothetical protein L7F22_040566 [Adiantum nelumboides]|nr:hypothetical protein [Adiantum nelumboides]
MQVGIRIDVGIVSHSVLCVCTKELPIIEILQGWGLAHLPIPCAISMSLLFLSLLSILSIAYLFYSICFRFCDSGIRARLPRFLQERTFQQATVMMDTTQPLSLEEMQARFAEFQSLFKHPEIQQAMQTLNQQREEETHEEGKEIRAEDHLPPPTSWNNRSQDMHGRRN